MADFSPRNSSDPNVEPIPALHPDDDAGNRRRNTPRSPGAAQGIAAVIVLIALAVTVWIVLS